MFPPAASTPTAGGHDLEFPSVTQPVATGRTASYRLGADIFACLTHREEHDNRVLSHAKIATIVGLRNILALTSICLYVGNGFKFLYLSTRFSLSWNYTGLCVGSMNFDEFLQLLLDKRRLTDPAADIRDAFRLFDKDADGYLTLKDLQQVACAPYLRLHTAAGNLFYYRFLTFVNVDSPLFLC